MASSPARGVLTKWIVDTLTTSGLLVGALKAPTSGGWNDDPQKPGSIFREYFVVTPMDSNQVSGALADPQTEWLLPYAFVATGVSWAQVEGQADKARRIVNEIGKVPLAMGTDTWKIVSIRANSIGGVDINRSANPNEFSQRDVVMVRISKEFG